jgi:UTP--glucose-1-phosphate uridylyltransferase
MEVSAEGNLASALRALPGGVLSTLALHGFDSARFVELARRFTAGELDNRVHGVVEPPAAQDVVRPPAPGSAAERELSERGEEALARGECALVVLAGGMATRMGSVVKALVEALPERTFLGLRLAEQAALARRYGKAPPLWLMTSHATDGPVRAALGARADGRQLATFVQGLSLRLTPEGTLFREADGGPSLYAPGHGDLPDALRRSGLLDRFLDAGGRYVLVANLDNLGGGVDPVLIGQHLAQAEPVTCEVVEKLPGDRGGIPARLDGRAVVLEEFRLPPDFDPARVPVFNSNTLAFRADALWELQLDWTYFVARKQVDGREAVQFERLINEVTFALPTRYLLVPRSGAASRFLPVKDQAELVARRPELEALCRARGML